MTRYYYTCPIKALYMMKEFGVEFEIENEDFEDEDDGFTEPYFDYRLWEIESPETINSLLDVLDCNGKIYVQSGNEHIFEPKEGDIGIERNLHSVDTCYFGGKYWAYENEERRSTPHQQRVKIILREGKQFFMPEVENDQITKTTKSL